LIETEDQRRWWFATHPEYSWSHTGKKSRKQPAEDDDPDKQEFMRKMTEAGHRDRKRLEEIWKRIEDDRSRARAVAEALNVFGKLARIRKLIDAARRMIVPKGRPPARLPPKGTPERAKIEADRQRGSRAKQREERENIRAGDKGSAVWSEKELEEIRQTGKFPRDTRWHHDPTVANRPDLAADPKVVHPLRGGDKAHLDAHGGNYQDPRK
jgi:hypothetical protein